MSKKKFKVLIYGCGNIGFRHLQGIVKSNNNIEIYVYDKSNIAILKAKKKLKEISQFSNLVHVTFLNSINIIEKNLDLVIVSTSSKERLKIIRNLISKFKLKFLILEKIAFQSVYQFKQALSLLKKNNTKAWVNCPRRLYKSYQDLIKQYDFNRETIMMIDGGNWWLSSNLIHFLDLFAYLFGDTKISLINNNLNQKIINSKRKGYMEFDGNIIFKNSKNYLLIVNAERISKKPLIILITNSNLRIHILQYSNIAIIESKKNNWKKTKIKFEMEEQSNLTTRIVNQLIDKKKCDLTDINESYNIHKGMLNTYKDHFSKILNKDIKNCPIT